MYELTVRTRFAAAHFLRDYNGPCSRLHGHTWQVEVLVKGHNVDENGMLIDFKEIKTSLKKVVDDLDHQNLNELEPFRSGKEENPTAENLARYIYGRIKKEIENKGHQVKLAMVRVWESPDASASFMEVE